MARNVNRHIEKTRRQERAAERKEAYEARSVEEQLQLIDKRPGESKKERARLENVGV